MTLTGRTRLKIWLVLVLVFALGGVTGAALAGLYRSRASGNRAESREHAKAERFEKMRRELNLTEEQANTIKSILDETRTEYRALRAELRPRFEQPRQKARAKIRALLNAEQQQKFDVLAAEQDARHNGEEKSRR